MALPNCLVIGAMRSGTSTLYQLMAQHPDIFMSTPKEPSYFVSPGEPAAPIEGSGSVTDPAEYEALFAAGAGSAVRGEASHNYLYYSDRAAPAIRSALGDIKLIAVLRNPVERAYSHYMLHVRNEQEDAASFAEALEREPDRIQRGVQFGHYTARGFYARQLRPFFQQFPRRTLRIHLYNDLVADAAGLAQDVYEFVGVDPSFTPDTSVRSNPSGAPRSRALHTVLVRDNPLKRAVQPRLPRPLYRWAVKLRDRNLGRTPMDPEIRQRLAALYRSDVQELQDLIGRDLGAWMD